MAVIDTPTPLTWTDDSLITAAILNNEIRDVIRFLTSGCACTVSRAATQSIPNNTATPVTWDTQLDDVDGIITPSSDTFTFTRDGIIAVRSYATFAAAIGGRRELMFTLNGSVISGAGSNAAITNSHGSGMCHSVDVAVLAGDTATINVFQNSGGAVNLVADSSAATLSWVGKVQDFTDLDDVPPDVPDPSNPPSAVPTKHTKVYPAQWSRSYDGNGSIMNNDPPYLYQGQKKKAVGNHRSLFGLPYQAIKADLKGATKITMELSFYTAFGDGVGVRTIIGGHDYVSKPSTWSDSRVDQHIHACYSKEKKVNTFMLGSKMRNGLKSGLYKGIAFGPGPAQTDWYYGAYNGATMANKPKLTIVYWK